jgi:hypothetical protein
MDAPMLPLPTHILGYPSADVFKMFVQAGIAGRIIGPTLLHTISRTSKGLYAVCTNALTRMRTLRAIMSPRVAEAYRRRLLATVPYERSAFRCYRLDELQLSPRGGVIICSDPPFMQGRTLALRRIHILLRDLTPLHTFVNLIGWAPLAYTYNDVFADAGAWTEEDHRDDRGRYLATVPMSTDYNPVLLGDTAFLPSHDNVEMFTSDRDLINGPNCIPDPEYMLANVSHIIVEYLVAGNDLSVDKYEFIRAQTQRDGTRIPFIRKIKNTANVLLD